MTDEQIKQAAIERGCIKGTAEYYGFIEGAQYYRAHQPSPWISIEERLPEDGDIVFTRSVLIIEGGGVRNEEEQYLTQKYTCRWITDKTKQTNMCGEKYDIVDKVTHWMPIPQIEK